MLTPEQREYKQRTLDQLRTNLPAYERRLSVERTPQKIDELNEQLFEMQTHITRLEHELASNRVIEPVADEMIQRAASAIAGRKFFLARKLINKVALIEPFYPSLDRMRREAEAGRVSRRTKAIAVRSRTNGDSDNGDNSDVNTSTTALVPYMPPTEATSHAIDNVEDVPPRRYRGEDIYDASAEEKPPRQPFFQFHIVISCLTVMFLLCVMSGIGAVTALQWLTAAN